MITLSGATAMIQATTADQLSNIPERFLEETKVWASLGALAVGIIIAVIVQVSTKNEVASLSVLGGAIVLAVVIYFIDDIAFRLFPALVELFTGFDLDGTTAPAEDAPPAAPERAPGA